MARGEAEQCQERFGTDPLPCYSRGRSVSTRRGVARFSLTGTTRPWLISSGRRPCAAVSLPVLGAAAITITSLLPFQPLIRSLSLFSPLSQSPVACSLRIPPRRSFCLSSSADSIFSTSHLPGAPSSVPVLTPARPTAPVLFWAPAAISLLLPPRPNSPSSLLAFDQRLHHAHPTYEDL